MSIRSSLQALKEAKTNIANAIVSKGGTVADGDGFGSFAEEIMTLPIAATPSIGFVPSAWDSEGYYTEGTWYGTSVPSSVFYMASTSYSKLVSISFRGGLTSIGDSAFKYCAKLALTSLPSTLTSIGSEAFQDCNNLALTSLPSDLTSIGNRAFQSCGKLAITSLPSNLTSISDDTFNSCRKLAITSIPSGVTSIGRCAFNYCLGLTSITFKGTPTDIHAMAFSGCSKITTINVPWAEGEVANAPWGATNATINYNYTGV